MKPRLKLFKIFAGCIFLLITNYKYNFQAIAEETLQIELDEELQKGNFILGLRPYLGGKNDNFSENNKISFKADKGFLNLYSTNGIGYKSRKINIIWKEIPLKVPSTIERLIFGPYASYESAHKKASNLKEAGLKATVAYPKDWEVWVDIKEQNRTELLNYKLFKKVKKSQIIPFLSDEYIFQKLEGPIFITSDNNLIINNINFGKKFFLVKDSYGTWTLVQQIKFDDYLKGVLPYEIGSNAPLEALKAQAIIARTWAIYNARRFNMDQYHLCITTQCQVYKPIKVENSEVQRAIKETSNLIVTYKNKPINSFFHGSNGGISAGPSESWEIGEIPYLKTMLDGSKSVKKSFNLPIHNESYLKQFLAYDKNKFFGKNHSLFRWEKKIYNDSIKKKLINKKFITENEDILELKVLERGFSGRVTRLEIKMRSPHKSIVLVKDEIRRILGFLPSNLFTINKLNDNLWIFRGGGFGHGVGLSQAGAIEMAELGFTYEQILNHYYPGTKIKDIGISSQ